MKIVADENILALDGWFGKKVKLQLVPGREISAEHVRDADALLVRSITRVDQALLQGSGVQFVGTATSGTDHLDLDWLAQQGITVADAAGANANAALSSMTPFPSISIVKEKREPIPGVDTTLSSMLRSLARRWTIDSPRPRLLPARDL